MAPCHEEYAAMQETLAVYGLGSPEHDEASEAYFACMRDYAAVAAARGAHAAGWDEKLWLLYQEIQAAWERLFGKLKLPPRPPCGPRSGDIRTKIFSEKSTAMLFSRKMQEAFREAGVALQEDETFACSVCVVKKPQYVSDALALDPLGLAADSGSRIHYILEPAIMAPALEAIERDKINYGAKGGT